MTLVALLILKLLLALVLLLALLALIGVLTHRKLPDNSQRTAAPGKHPASANPQGPLAEHLLPQIAANQGLTGILPLAGGHEAFLARLALSEAARHTLDVQYYIWHGDISGRLLLQSIYKAAERGVHVRLLLDDNNTKGKDGLLAALNAHPNIQVRLFNPFMQRRFRLLGYLSDFFRLNRRMHNKSFTADGLATILGGRNIGDEYFDVGSGVMFADLDILATGAIAQEVVTDFERYWTSESAYPAERIISSAPEPFSAEPAQSEGTQTYLQELREFALASQLKNGQLPLQWVSARLVSDDPAKGLGKAPLRHTILADIGPLIESAEHEVFIISPYFVPTKSGCALLAKMARSGKKVTILTNSLAATDVAPVHAGYAKYRRKLLKAGAHIYELKPETTVHTKNHGGITGSSGASLHAKTFTVDRRHLFIGSFNMDPRSAMLNTEMGLIIDCPALAAQLAEGVKAGYAANSYAVTLNPQKRLHWQTEERGENRQFDNEPQSTMMQRCVVSICSFLPIEWLL